MAKTTLSATEYDPLFLHARREAGVVLLGWVVFFIWVIAFSAWRGFPDPGSPERVDTTLGMPSWVFWGVAMPWLFANLFTFWFAFSCMADDVLAEVKGEEIVLVPRRESGSAKAPHGK